MKKTISSFRTLFSLVAFAPYALRVAEAQQPTKDPLDRILNIRFGASYNPGAVSSRRFGRG